MTAAVEKPAPPKYNRAEKRAMAKELRREFVKFSAPDRVTEYRANRRKKRLAANATRNRNRRLAK